MNQTVRQSLHPPMKVYGQLKIKSFKTFILKTYLFYCLERGEELLSLWRSSTILKTQTYSGIQEQIYFQNCHFKRIGRFYFSWFSGVQIFLYITAFQYPAKNAKNHLSGVNKILEKKA